MKWFGGLIIFGVLFLSACGTQPTPGETLETAALTAITVDPISLNVPADSQTGIFVTAFGTFASTDTFVIDLVNTAAGINITSFTQTASVTGRKLFLAILQVNSSVVTGNYTPVVRVRSGGISKTAPLDLTVTAAPANPTFKLTVQPNSLEIARGSSLATTVYVTRIKGFNQKINLSLDTSATTLSGVTANPVNLASTGFTGRVLVTASSTATPFGLPLVNKVKGVSGAITKQANLTITVKTPSGELDPSFDTDGMVITDGGRVYLQSNDKIIISRTTGPFAAKFIELRRLNVNGTLDTTFGINGVTTVTLPDFDEAILIQLAVASDDKMLLLVRGVSGQVPSLILEDNLIRLRSNGQIDTTFATAGQFRLSKPSNLKFNFDQMALRQNGNIVVQGDEFNSRQTKLVTQVVLANGSGLDTSFGTSGTSILSSRFYAYGLDMALQTDGKIVVVGTSESLIDEEDCVVVRLTASGQFDTSFHGDGINRVPFGHILESFDEVVIDTQGRIIASGTSLSPLPSQSKLLMARFTPAGNLDDTFSGNGKLELDHEVPGVKMVLQSDNKQVFFGHEFEEDTLIRQTVGGVFDTSFSGDGQVTLPNAINGGVSLAIDSKGRMIVSGIDGVARFAP